MTSAHWDSKPSLGLQSSDWRSSGWRLSSLRSSSLRSPHLQSPDLPASDLPISLTTSSLSSLSLRSQRPQLPNSQRLDSDRPYSPQNDWIQNPSGLMQWNNSSEMPYFSFLQTQKKTTEVIVRVGLAAHLAEALEVWVMPKMVLLQAEQMDAIALCDDNNFSTPAEVLQGIVPLPCLVDPEQSTAEIYPHELILILPKLAVTHSPKVRGHRLIPTDPTLHSHTASAQV